MPVILGHDPSLASYGLALVDTDGPMLLAWSVIETSAKDSRAERLRVIFGGIRTRLDHWLETQAIDSAAFEAGFSFAGAGRGADLAIAEARGVGYVACAHLECVTLAPNSIRKAICGNGAAKKPEAVAAVVRILGAELPPDAADAAAVALAVGGFSVPSTTKQETKKARSGTRAGGDREPRNARRTKAG